MAAVVSLASYLARTGETVQDFASRAEVSTGLVCGARQGRPVSDALIAQRIVQATGGEVTLEDLAGGGPVPLAIWLREHDLDPAEWAAEHGLSVKTIADMCRGQRLRSMQLAQRISKATGGAVPLADLVCSAEDRAPRRGRRPRRKR